MTSLNPLYQRNGLSFIHAHKDEDGLDDKANLSQSRVLVVDDNSVNRELLLALLKRMGVGECDIATDGEEALYKVKDFMPDLLLLDIMMPKMDGFEVCSALRQQPVFAALPILVQTSLNRAEDRARAFAAGATDFVTKPLNAAELMARVRIHLQNRVLIQSLSDYHQRTSAGLALARAMQLRLMPQHSDLENLANHGFYIDAVFQPSSELGGDFWGVKLQNPQRLLIYTVDFSGHGVNAALNTFRLHALIQRYGLDEAAPASSMEILNNHLCQLLQPGQFATMLLGVVDRAKGLFEYASAGAPAPLYWQEDKGPAFGQNAGLPMGLMKNARYDSYALPIEAKSWLFLYSDAVTEAQTDQGLFGEEGLLQCAEDYQRQNWQDAFTDRLLPRLGNSQGSGVDDDLTALALCFKAQSARNLPS
jgi:phosphoserine phosphatase RsbU/P